MSRIERKRMQALVDGLWILLEGKDKKIQEVINEYIKQPIDDKDTLQEILKNLDEIDKIMQAFLERAMTLEYAYGAHNALKHLSGTPSSGLDSKAITILTKTAKKEFSDTIQSSKKKFEKYFKLTKQKLITEKDIQEALADGLVDSQSGAIAKDYLTGKLEAVPEKIIDKEALKKYKKRKLAQLKKRIEENGAPAGLKKFMLEKAEEDFLNGKFLQIRAKNGRVYTYQTKTYASIVARTRVGDAQVHGTIEQARRYGVTEFKVTSHQSKTKKDRDMEGKILTTNPKNLNHPKVDDMLNEETRPLYHPNCLHRIFPVNI